MNQIAAHSFHIVARLIGVLVALFGAPARCVARLRAMRGRTRYVFAHVLQFCAERGLPIAQEGEDEATVEARIARLEWICADPHKAGLHMARLARGVDRLRKGEDAPFSFAPPVLACAVLVGVGPTFAPEPDT